MHKAARQSINIILGMGVFILVVVKPLYNRLTVPVYADRDPDSSRVNLNASFSSISLNQHVRYKSSFFPGSKSNPATIRQVVRQSFRIHSAPDPVFYGASAKAPVGWIYTELVNATKLPLNLVLSFPHYRCDRATLYIGKGHRLAQVGTLANHTKLTDRFFPYLSYAFPIHLNPGDTTLSAAANRTTRGGTRSRPASVRANYLRRIGLYQHGIYSAATPVLCYPYTGRPGRRRHIPVQGDELLRRFHGRTLPGIGSPLWLSQFSALLTGYIHQ